MTPKDTNHVRFVELEDGPYREYRKDHAITRRIKSGPALGHKAEAEGRAART